MSTIITGKRQNNIEQLNKLSAELYESIFNVNLIENKDKAFYFYNTLDKIIFPDYINKEVFDVQTLTADLPWTTLSHKLYQTISLWWIIFLLNDPEYIFKAKAGKSYKFIKPEYISNILSKLNNNEQD
tara:strand:- start:387 stop:770 length:384 start_codon:yes stop_codon:yes gene_type:complete